ncbi:helix-turn-helix domain-containing protein [Novosphingobium sp. BL-52-GroH]|uniref:helix-turn-helix domain-containing protein n=1 Tax=Novosphingobium sp. BL-52-GroH TaxID=3349877 RepID=UPI00384C7C7A
MLYARSASAMIRSPNIRSLSRGLAVLECFRGGNPLTQIEIAQATGLPYPTVWRILMTLTDLGYLETLPVSERYALTARALVLSAGFQDRENMVQRFRPAMDTLCHEVLWPISLAAPAGSSMVVRYSTHNATTMTYTVYKPGFATPLGQSATGVAYLSALPQEERDHLAYSLGLEQVDREILIEQMKRARDLGYAAYERSRFNPTPGKLSTIAVPVFQGETVLGALALSFFANAMSLQQAIERYIPRLKQIANCEPLEDQGPRS